MNRFYLANSRGFISVYAIIFLLIFMAITILIQAEITTLVHVQKNDTLTEVCILQNIRKKRIDQTGDDKEQDVNKTTDEIVQDVEDPIIQITCGNTDVTLHVTPQQVTASFLSKKEQIQMLITLSEEGYIKDYAYE